MILGGNNHEVLIADGKVSSNIIRDTGTTGVDTEDGGNHAEIHRTPIRNAGTDRMNAARSATKV